MECLKCGLELPESAGFCPECGTKVEALCEPPSEATGVPLSIIQPAVVDAEPDLATAVPSVSAQPAPPPPLSFSAGEMQPAPPPPPAKASQVGQAPVQAPVQVPAPAPLGDMVADLAAQTTPNFGAGSPPTVAPAQTMPPYPVSTTTPVPELTQISASQPGFVTVGQSPAAVPVQPKKKSKLPLVIGLVLLAVLLIVGGIVGFNVYQENQRKTAYAAAQAAMDDADWAGALAAFEELGDYEDSATLASLCQQNIDYEAAYALYDKGEYEKARKAFKALAGFKDSDELAYSCQQNLDFRAAQQLFEDGDIKGARSGFISLSDDGFSQADSWIDKCDYALAEELLTNGENYAAWQAFNALGSYEDATERAEACQLPFPMTGIIWDDAAYTGGHCGIEFDCTNSTYARAFEIYNGDTCVALVFVNPGDKQIIEVVPGDYSVVVHTGDLWWGGELLFGDEGYSRTLTYDDGTDWFSVAYNDLVQLVFNYE